MFSDIEFLKKILDTIEEGVVVSDEQGFVVGYNQQALKILCMSKAFPPGRKLVQPNWKMISEKGENLKPEELPESLTRLTGKAQKNFVLGLTIEPHCVKWLNVNTQALSHDGTEYVFSTFIDITEKHNLQGEVLNAKERLRYALKGSEIGVWEYNAETRELYFSEEWKKIVGYKPAHVEKAFEQWSQYIHSEDRDFVLKGVNDCLINLSSGFKIEYRLNSPKGGYKWIHSIGKITARTQSGEPLRFSGTIRDVTDRRNADNLIHASEKKFKNAFNHSAIGMAIINAQGNWVDVNPALCEMLGYKKAEFSGFTFQNITHPEDLAGDLRYVEKMIHGDIDSYELEKRFFRKDGAVVWVLSTVSTIWSADQGSKNFIAQIIDVTNAKDLIAQLESKNTQLNLASSDLKNKIEQLEEFNRIVAHNLRGPVGNVMQLVDMLGEGKESPDLYLPMLKEATNGLDGTLSELIKILEIKLNKDIDYQTCNVEAVIQKVNSMLNVQISQHRIKFINRLNVKTLSYPKVYLESILYNLISNAIKYRRTNIQSEVIIKTYLEDNRAVLEVSDNGLGIDLHRYGHQVFKLNKIFHKGFDSKGLGLFIVKNQIEALGGTISLASEPNKGSTFKIVF